MKSLVRISALALTALSPIPVFAQDAPAGEAADSADAGEIVVTARKREESLQEVPVAITALGADELQSARVETLQDVAKLTPGLNYTPLFGRQNQLPIIRGVAQTLGALNVGVFLDGVYLSGKASVDLELNDLERVEVIKGPQSALYGRNTFAGAINYVTARPTSEVSGRAEFTVGTRGLYKSIVSVSGPLSDTLRVRVGGYSQKSNGFYRSAIDGGRVDFTKSYGGTGTLEWQPDDALTVTLRGTYFEDDDGQPPSNVIRNNSGIGFPSGAGANPLVRRNLLYVGQLPEIPRNGVQVSTRGINIRPGSVVPIVFRNNVGAGGVTSAANVTAQYPEIDFFGDKQKSLRTSLTFEYDFGNATMTAISAYARRKFDYTYDGDNTVCDQTTAIPAVPPFPVRPAGGCPNFGFPAVVNPVGQNNYALSSAIGTSKDYSQELRFQSSGDNRIDWLFGFFYYHNRNASIDRSIAPVTQATANSYLFPRQVIKTDSYAAFGSLNFKITDALTLSGELRYEYEEQSFTQVPTNPAGGGATAATATRIERNVSNLFDLEQDFRFTTPRVILDYKLSDDNLIYVSYSRGAKTGGFNTGINIFPNQRTFDGEFADNYEAGVKTTFDGGRIRANLAGFIIDWKDQQVVDQNPVTAGGSSTNRSYTTNSASSKIYGLEFDAVARLANFFTLSGNYAFTDAEYRSFTDATLNGIPAVPGPAAPGNLALAGLPNINFDGRRLPYVPRHKFVVSPILTFPFMNDDGSIEARADISYQSKTFLRADNFAFFDDRTNVDLRLTANYDMYRLQLFVNNVTNERSPVAGVRFFDSTNFSVSSPYVTGYPGRQYGASFGVKF